MHFKKLLFISAILIISNKTILFSQEKNYYQTDFTISEFEARRSKVFNEIGTNSIALIQGGAVVTKNGVENLSAFPSKIKEIEKTIKEKGLTEFRPSKSLPLEY